MENVYVVCDCTDPASPAAMSVLSTLAISKERITRADALGEAFTPSGKRSPSATEVVKVIEMPLDGINSAGTEVFKVSRKLQAVAGSPNAPHKWQPLTTRPKNAAKIIV